MIFKYCHPTQRQELAFISKTWSENLQAFAEDYQLDLYNCFLRDDIDPVSLLMNTSRKYRYLHLGYSITSQSPDVTKRFLSTLGKDVQFLDLTTDGMKLLEDPDSLMMFPQLKELTLWKIGDLARFEQFPESLEHIHTNQLSIMELTKDIEPLQKIKNLKSWTADKAQLKGGLDALIQIAAQFGTISSSIFSLNETFQLFLESLQDLENIYLKFSNNFIGTPVVTFADVTEISLKGQPKTFTQFNEFPNLRSIDISWDRNQNATSSCFNFHQKVVCPKVEELRIDWIRDRTCMGCFRTLIDSFPNMKKLILNHCRFGNEHIKYICFKLPKLKHLEIESNQVSSRFFVAKRSYLEYPLDFTSVQR